MSQLKRSKNDVRQLLKYLHARGFKSNQPGMEIITPVHCKGEDLQNSKDPRAFCAVEAEDDRIFCAAAIEELPARNRVGILLHEIVHIWQDAFDGDECEVDVDEWIIRNLPEAEYEYEDLSPEIQSIQSVSMNFLALIGV